MDDKLEKYIKNHRAAFDSEVPEPAVWEGISRELELKKGKMRRLKPLVIWRAAAVILLLVSVTLMVDKWNSGNGSQIPQVAMSEQMSEAENFYSGLIQQKVASIRTKADKYNLGDDFMKDLDRLDSAYQQLKVDLASGDEDYVESAMILNLQLRIEILNRQLQIIQSMENIKKNEGISL